MSSSVPDILSDLNRVIDQISKEKAVKRQFVINSIVQGVLMAARRKYGTYRDIEAKYNEETNEVELFEFKKVVPDNEFEDELIEIKYSDALSLDPEAQLEDQIGQKLDLEELGRIDAHIVKQIIMQNLREAEHEIIYKEFEKRKGEIASGTVRRADEYNIVVELDKTEAYIPRREQIPGESYKSGDRIQGYILEVRQTSKGPQIIMSRACPQYLIKLFEAEAPEVYEGIVKIVDAAREPGQRAKMAVYSTDAAVHPVGACVGVKGSRVQNITQELKGERVDIIIWEEDPVKYICNALAPAKAVRCLVDKENQQMQIIVPDDQLSLAIGKRGQNVRLAVKLTGWDLDLVSESQALEKKRQALFNLCLLPEVNETQAESVHQYGFSSFQELAEAETADVQDIPGYEQPEEAEKLIQASLNLLKKYKAEGKKIPVLPPLETQKKSAPSDLKEKAEEILKKELAQLSGKDPAEAKVDGPAGGGPASGGPAGGADPKTSAAAASAPEKSAAEKASAEKSESDPKKKAEEILRKELAQSSGKETSKPARKQTEAGGAAAAQGSSAEARAGLAPSTEESSAKKSGGGAEKSASDPKKKAEEILKKELAQLSGKEKTKVGGPAGRASADGKPASGKPASGKPASGKPASGEPVSGKSAADKSADGKPAADKSAADKPAPGEPASGKPAPGAENTAKEAKPAPPPQKPDQKTEARKAKEPEAKTC